MSWIAFAMLVAVVVSSPLVASAQALRPFSKVQSVGPGPAPAYDEIVLKGGEKVAAVVVAENSMFYVLERFGEYRAVGRDKVASIKRNPDARRDEANEDQILCKNGHVLTGKIVSERPDGMVEIKQPNQTVSQAVWRSEITAMFKGRKQVLPAGK